MQPMNATRLIPLWLRIYDVRSLVPLIVVYALLSCAIGGVSVQRLGPLSFQVPIHLGMLLPVIAGFVIASFTMLESNFAYPQNSRFRVARLCGVLTITVFVLACGLSYRLIPNAHGGELALIRNTVFFAGFFMLSQRVMPRTFWIPTTSFLFISMFLGYNSQGFYWWALPLWDGSSKTHFTAALIIWGVALAVLLHSPARRGQA